MRRVAAAALATGLFLTACGGGGGGTAGTSRPPTTATIAASALDGTLLGAGDINSVMGTTAMVLGVALTYMADHANLLPNLNCLGVWGVGERAIYDGSGWTAIRGQVLRQPDTAGWDSMVVEAAVSFRSAGAAYAFFTASADRWSKCSNHRVNMTVKGQRTTWMFGALGRTDTDLTMHLIRNGGERACQRALSVTNNVVVDVAACSKAVGDQAVTIANKIQSKLPA